MKKTIRNKWLKALRSDEYEQGKGTLVRPINEHDEFCCLGVLCDVLGEEFEKNAFGTLGVSVNGDSINTGSLPIRLLEQVSMNQLEQGCLVTMNDKEGKSFKQIANWIEKNL